MSNASETVARLPVRVAAIRQETADVRAFQLESLGPDPLPAFTPGAHIDVHPPGGPVRQYSLCNLSGAANGYEIAVKREPSSRGGSRAMHERVAVGDVLQIGRPRNNFALAEAADHHLLLAGGIGVTPLLGMARHLRRSEGSFRLHYFTRSLEETPFREALLDGPLRTRVGFEPGLAPDEVQQRLGALLRARPPGAHLYLCGPGPFMAAVRSAAADWPSSAVHMEYFAGDPGMLAAAQLGFRVRLARTGGDYDVPEGKSIVEVLARHGVALETSCEQGVCGTCLTSVLEGLPDHRDVYLTDAEKAAGDRLCPCVSRSLTELLVLDL